jgi:hypothetical protein
MPDTREPGSSLRRGSDWALVALGIAIVAGGGYLLLRRPAGEPPPAPPPVAAPADATAAAPAAQEPDGPATADDASVRRQLGAASADPSFRRWLGERDLARRWAIVTDNLAEGVSPRAELSFLAPARPFSAVDRGRGRLAIAPESYARYDAFAEAVGSLDAAALARAYHALHAAIEGAYRGLGYPGASLDRVTGRALRRIAAAPVRDGDVLVVDDGGIHVFADPKLEALGDVEKHLLRMGPRNERILQAKASELLLALGLPAEAPTGKR